MKRYTFYLHDTDAISLLRYLNGRKTDREDMKRIRKFFTRFRAELAQKVINESAALKLLKTPPGDLHTANTPIK